MNLNPNASSKIRYVALDVHKHYIMVGGLNANHDVVLRPRRVSISCFADWASNHLRSSDQVVIEATTNTWTIYDIVAPLVARTVVGHPPEMKKIVDSRVKTDKQAVKDMAKLLIADLIPQVWVPPKPVRQLRALISHRLRLVKTSTMLRNRLHSVIHRHNLLPPKGRLFAQKHRDWWTDQDLPLLEKLQVAQNLATLDHLSSQIDTIDNELARLSNSDPWASQTPFVMQIPGFGLITSMTVLAAIGNISRFPTAKKLVGYSGLYPSVHQSGETHRHGRITKQGRKDLRWAAVEAAWAAVRSNPYWKSQFNRLKKRLHPNQAIVAIARRLLVALWHVLTKKEPYRLSSQEKTVRKMLRWSWRMDDRALDGLTRQQFIRYALMRVGVGYDLPTIEYGGYPHRIASAEEVLAICPELGPPD